MWSHMHLCTTLKEGSPHYSQMVFQVWALQPLNFWDLQPINKKITISSQSRGCIRTKYTTAAETTKTKLEFNNELNEPLLGPISGYAQSQRCEHEWKWYDRSWRRLVYHGNQNWGWLQPLLWQARIIQGCISGWGVQVDSTLSQKKFTDHPSYRGESSCVLLIVPSVHQTPGSLLWCK